MVRLRISRFVHASQRQYERNEGKQHVDQKHPLPTQKRSNSPADDWTKAQADTKDDAPPAESDRALMPAVELVGEHGNLTDQHGASARALQKPRHDERRDIRGHPAYQRGEAE